MASISIQSLIRKQSSGSTNSVRVNNQTKTIYFKSSKTPVVNDKGKNVVSLQIVGDAYGKTILSAIGYNNVIIEKGWTVNVTLPTTVDFSNEFIPNSTLIINGGNTNSVTLINRGVINITSEITTNRVPPVSEISLKSNILGISVVNEFDLTNNSFLNEGKLFIDINIKKTTQQKTTSFAIDEHNSVVGVFAGSIVNRGSLLVRGPSTSVNEGISMNTNLKKNAYILEALVGVETLRNGKSGVITILPRYTLEKCQCFFSITPTLVNFGIISGDTNLINKGIFNIYANTRFGGGSGKTAFNLLQNLSIYRGWNSGVFLSSFDYGGYLPPNSNSCVKGIIQRYQCFYRKSDDCKKIKCILWLAHTTLLFSRSRAESTR